MTNEVEVHAVEAETNKIVEIKFSQAVVDAAFPPVVAVSDAEEQADRRKYEKDAALLVRRWLEYERTRIVKSHPRPITPYQQNKLSYLAGCLTDTLVYNIRRVKPIHSLFKRRISSL